MASNAATRRILNAVELAGINVVEVSDDVYGILPHDVDGFRAIIGNQPHFQYFLNRDMRLRRKVINDSGDGVWVLYKAGTAQWYRKLFETMAKATLKTNIPMGATAYGVPGQQTWSFSVDVESSRINPAVYPDEPSAFGAAQPYGDAFTKYIERQLGVYHFGFAHTLPTTVTTDVLVNGWSVPSYSLSGRIDKPAANPNQIQVQGKVDMYGTTASTYVGELVSPEYVMICGPSTAYYGEFIAGLDVILGDPTEIADRIEAVVAHTKAEGAPADAAEVTKALADMRSLKGYVVAFRGSAIIDIATLWRRASVGGTMTLATMPIVEGVITEESRAKGIAEWVSESWCLTTWTLDSLDDGVIAAMQMSTLPLTYRYKSDTEVHVADGEGTVAMSYGSASVALVAAKRAGRTVGVQSSPLNPASGANATWDDLVNLVTGTLVGQPSVGDVWDNIDDLTGSMCLRMIQEPDYDSSEEMLVLPTLSPQAMWTSYAREVVATEGA